MSLDPNLILFYVQNVESSICFYAELLNADPIHSEPDYAMFLLKSGLRLGLWSQSISEPKSKILGGGCELAIQVDDEKTVDQYFAHCQSKKFKIIQNPTHMDFGYTFVVCDPDEHRIRLFVKG